MAFEHDCPCSQSQQVILVTLATENLLKHFLMQSILYGLINNPVLQVGEISSHCWIYCSFIKMARVAVQPQGERPQICQWTKICNCYINSYLGIGITERYNCFLNNTWMKGMQESDCSSQNFWEWEVGQHRNSYYTLCGVSDPWFLCSFVT